MLLIDDKPLPQSGAIVRYLAREFNLQPENSLLIAYADMIVETLGGAFEKFPYFEKDEAKKVICKTSFVFTEPGIDGFATKFSSRAQNMSIVVELTVEKMQTFAVFS